MCPGSISKPKQSNTRGIVFKLYSTQRFTINPLEQKEIDSRLAI